MVTKKAQVIMLPTKDKTQIFTSRRDDKLHYHFKGHTPNNIKSYQHLYITSDDEIEGGDWCYDKMMKRIHQTPNAYSDKIIATTDKFLVECDSCSIDKDYRHNFNVCKCIVQPSRAFIEEYCKVGGINEVLVEYIREECSQKNATVMYSNTWYKDIPKVNSHNIITILPIKTSRTKEEVEELCKQAYSDGSSDMYNTSRRRKSFTFHTTENAEDWIKNNL